MRQQLGWISRSRPAFTLIELLVVIMLMIFIATIGVLLLPRLNEQERAGRGADQLQGWFLIAKQRALRSGLPSGIRLVGDPQNPNFISEVLYIEQPADFIIQPGVAGIPQSPLVRRIFVPQTVPPTTAPTPPPLGTPPVLIAQIEQPSTPTPAGVQDFTGGVNTTALNDDPAWPIQPGDYLELQGGGLVHQILHVHPSFLELALPAVLPSPLTSGNLVDPTATYRIIRGPRVLQGEEPLKLPANVGIYTGNPTATPPIPGSVVGPFSGPGNSFSDFLFAPSGRLISPNVDPIYLWVADSTTDDPTREKEPVLLSIKAATGFISTYPVDTQWTNPNWNQTGNPYVNAQSGRASGL